MKRRIPFTTVIVCLAMFFSLAGIASGATGSAGSSTLIKLAHPGHLGIREARQVLHSALRYEGVLVRMGACRRGGGPRRVTCAYSIYLSVTFAGATTYEWAPSSDTVILTRRGRILCKSGGLMFKATL